jgi:hypothetical protein
MSGLRDLFRTGNTPFFPSPSLYSHHSLFSQRSTSVSYLDKAKTVPNHKPTEPKEILTAEKANDAKEGRQTLLTPPDELRNKSGTLPCLPWQLERLLSAASSNVLTADLPGVPDPSAYTLAWGCAYLTGDRSEAEHRLWQVYRAWKGSN